MARGEDGLPMGLLCCGTARRRVPDPGTRNDGCLERAPAEAGPCRHWFSRRFGSFLPADCYGGILGSMIGLIGGLFQRARPGTFAAWLWAAANRPIRLFAQEPEHRNIRRFRSRVVSFGGTGRGWLAYRSSWSLVAAYGVGAYVGRMVDRRLADAISAADRDDPNWRLDDLMGQPRARARRREFRADRRRGALNTSRELAKWSRATAGSAEAGSFSAVGGLRSTGHNRGKRSTERRCGRCHSGRAGEARREAVEISTLGRRLSEGTARAGARAHADRHSAAGDAGGPDRGAPDDGRRGDPGSRW